MPYGKILVDQIESSTGKSLNTGEVVNDLQSIARSLNVADSAVIYSADTVTVLDNVQYIYDAGTQTTWGVPTLNGSGETITDVTGSDLTTTGGSYTLTSIGSDSQVTQGIVYPFNPQTILTLGSQSTQIPAGVTRLRVNTGGLNVGELLYLWEASGDFNTTVRTITDITKNIFEEYVVTTSSGAFKFVTQKILQLRGHNAFPTAEHEIYDTGWGVDPSGLVESGPQLQSAIDYMQSYGSGSRLFSTGGAEDTRFGGRLMLSPGKPKISQKIIIAAVSTGNGTGDAKYSGVKIAGAGRTNTVLDFSGQSVSDDSSLHVQGSVVDLSDFQIKNSKGHGVKFEHLTPTTSLWDINVERVFVNISSGDGFWFGSCFLTKVSKCQSYGAGGFGFSFNGFHTSLQIEYNYSNAATLGGYLIGDRDDIALSQGCVYSTLKCNACDNGINAYTLGGCKGVDMSGNGTENITGYPIYISGTDSNVTINGFFADRVTESLVFLEGSRAVVTIDGMIEKNPLNTANKAIRAVGSDSQVILSNINHGRTYLYDSNENGGVTVKKASVKNKQLSVDGVAVTEIATLSHSSGGGGSYGGTISVQAFFGSSVLAESSLNTTTYQLLVNKGAGGSDVVELAYAGLKTGGTSDPETHPSFTFSFVGDSLRVIHTNSAATTKLFSFVISSSDEISVTV